MSTFLSTLKSASHFLNTFLSTLKSASHFLNTFLSAVIFFEFFLVRFFHFRETQTFMLVLGQVLLYLFCEKGQWGLGRPGVIGTPDFFPQHCCFNSIL